MKTTSSRIWCADDSFWHRPFAGIRMSLSRATARHVLTSIAVIAALSASSTLAAQTTAPAARPADVSSADAIIGALYDVISGPAGQARDWDRLRSLFIPDARLIYVRPSRDSAAAARVMTPDGYITSSGRMLEQRGFFEREISQISETFGGVAHRFSTYESRARADDPTPFARGINSIQLLNDGRRWWVVTIYWDSERPGNPIPAKYLPK
jgi:hypothetical protein